jgi:drug/metabolite transporter (DMT)-like permease
MTLGLHQVRAGRATALGYVQVLLSMVAGIWLFAEDVNLVAWIGATVLAISAALLATDRKAGATAAPRS